jgi:hypothetical protein
MFQLHLKNFTQRHDLHDLRGLRDLHEPKRLRAAHPIASSNLCQL